MIDNSRGMALLEVLIALAILTISGLASVSLVDASLRHQLQVVEREQAIDTASRVLTALSLLRGKDLSQRLGTSALGEFEVTISRPETGLYRIALAHTQSRQQELLVTIVYRP